MFLTSTGTRCQDQQLSQINCVTVFQYNLSQIVDCPTCTAGNVLDLIFTDCDSVINSLVIHSNIVHPVTSDHYLISLLSYYQTFSKCKTPTLCMIIPKVTMKAYVNASSTQT